MTKKTTSKSKTYYACINHWDPEDVTITSSETKASKYDYVDEVEGKKGDLVITSNNDENVTIWNTKCKSEEELKNLIKEKEMDFKENHRNDNYYNDNVIEFDGECIIIFGICICDIYDEKDDNDNPVPEDFYEAFKNTIDNSYVDCDSSSQYLLHTL